MDTLSPDLPDFLRLIIALGIVLALMGGLAFLLKKLGLAQNQLMKNTDEHRLSIVESIPLDARRRLAILKCDEKEHLVILSGDGETLIDSDITSVDGSHKKKKSA